MSLSLSVLLILLDQIFLQRDGWGTVWVRLDELDLAAGDPIKKIDLVNGTDRVGKVSSEFKSTEPYVWAKPMTTA